MAFKVAGSFMLLYVDMYYRLYILDHIGKLNGEPSDAKTTVKVYEHLNTNRNGSCEGIDGECVEVYYNKRLIKFVRFRISSGNSICQSECFLSMIWSLKDLVH